jgi:hypothetical protein
VKNKNLLGILAESTMELDGDNVPILDIIVPINSAGIISDVSLDSISIGDTVDIEVMGKKYQIKDKKISIIGRVVVMKTTAIGGKVQSRAEDEDEDLKDPDPHDFDQDDMVDDDDDDGDEDDGDDEEDGEILSVKKSTVEEQDSDEDDEEEDDEDDVDDEFSDEEFYEEDDGDDDVDVDADDF